MIAHSVRQSFYWLLVLLLLSNYTTSAQSNHTVVFTGASTDFNAVEKYSASANNTDYYLTFDANNLYLGAFRTSGSFGSADNFTVYIDTDPNATPLSGTGTSTGQNYNSVTGSLPFSANYNLHAEQFYQEARSFGSNWASTIAGLTFHTGGTWREVAIPFSSIGNPSALYITMWMGYAGGIFSNAPGTNIAASGNPAILSYFGGFGVTSVDCIPANITNLAISDGINNSVPAAGAIYGKLTVSSGTVTNLNSWTLAPGGSIVVSGGTFAIGAQTITMGNATTSNGKGTTINTSGTGAITTTASSVFDFGGEGNITGNALLLNGMVRIRNKFTPLASGNLTFASGSSLDIRSGGYVSTNAPNYSTGSTLIYNSGNVYTAGIEWTSNAVSGTGVPADVIIGNNVANSVCSFGSSGSFRQARGSVTISSAFAGSGLTLSTSSGGDLRIGGNFVQNGTFTHNTRSVQFNGNIAQAISGTLNNGTALTNILTNVIVSNTTATVSLNSSANIGNSFTINSNARLDVTSGITLTLNSGITSSVAGFLRNSSGTITPSGTLTIANGGVYEHNYTTTSGAIPIATWNPGSSCKIIGITSYGGPMTSANGWGQSFYNFEWACPNQTSSTNWQLNATTPPTIIGNFIVSNTNSATNGLRLSSSGAYTLNIAGDLQINSTSGNAKLDITNGGTAIINVGNNITLSQPSNNATLQLTSGTGSINFNKSSGIQQFSSNGTIAGLISFNAGTGTSTNTVQLSSNIALGTSVFNVLSSASADFQSYILSGAGTFNAANGSTLISANTNASGALNTSGASGSVQTTTRTFTNAGVSYTFNASSAQFTGTAPGAAANIKNLTINNSSGVTLSATATVSATGIVTFSSGNLDLSAYNLVMTSGASFSGVGTGKYVKTSNTGVLRQSVTASAVMYPVGNSSYNPVSISTGTNDTYDIRVSDGAIAAVSPNDISLTINRLWMVSEGVAGGSLTVNSISYNTGEENNAANFNAASQAYIGLNDGGWSQSPATQASQVFTNGNLTPATAVYSLAMGKDLAFLVPIPAPTVNASGGVVVSSPGSGTSGYVGATVTINGNNLDQVNLVKVGGSSGTNVPILAQTTTTLTFLAINTGGQVYVQNSGGNATSTESYTNLGYITTSGATDWNTGVSWLGGSVPPAGAVTTIAHNLTVSSPVAANPSVVNISSGIVLSVTAAAGSLTASTSVSNSGTISFTGSGSLTTALLVNNALAELKWPAAGTLNIAASGTFTNNGTFTRGTGTLNFIGTGMLNGSAALTVNNLTINSGTVTLTNVPVIDGVFTIKGGNISAGVVYTANSTLAYNTTYTRFTEWNASGVGVIGTTAGYPNNVTISSGTFTLLNGDATTARALAGNLTIAGGATFATGARSAALTVGGDITINGTLTLAGTSVGGDLNAGGNFTNAGTYTDNNRSLNFIGKNGVQTFTGVTAISYLNINNTSLSNPNVILGNALTINSGGTLWLTSGRLVPGAYDLTLAASATISGGSAASFVAAESTGSLVWNFATATSYGTRNYPLGVTSPSVLYTPVTFTTFNNTGSAGTFGLRTVSSADPNIANPSMPSHYITRYWVPSVTGLNAYTIANTNIGYSSPSEVVGTEASLQLAIWNNGVSGWQNFGGSGSAGQVSTGTSITNAAFGSGNNISARSSVQLYYRTAAAGPADWSAPAVWETSTSSGFATVSTATVAPNYLNAVTTTIRSGHSITTSSTVNAGALTIDGTLNLNSGVFNLVRTSGTDLSISAPGRLNFNNSSSNSINFNTGTVTIVSGYLYNAVLSAATNYNGSFTFSNGSTYENAVNGGSIPPATWAATSTAYFTGNTSGIPGNLNQAFGHFKWNCNQTQVMGLGLGSLSPSMAVTGDLTIQNTGSSELRLFSQTAGGSLTVSGDTYIQSGSLAVFGGGTYTINRTVNLNLGKNLYLSGAGILNLTTNSNSPALSGTHSTNVYLAGNLDISGTAQILQPYTSNVVSAFVFNGAAATQTYTTTNNSALSSAYIGWGVGDITGAGACTNTLQLNNNFVTNLLAVFRVYNKATLWCPNELYVSGALVGFNLYSGANIKIGSASGIASSGASGNIQTSGSRSFDGGAHYHYTGAYNQSTGNGLPSVITGSLRISNTGSTGNNTVTLTTNNTETKSLYLNSGLFAAGTNQTLKISNTGMVDGSGGGDCVYLTATGGNIYLLGNNTVTGIASGRPRFYDVTIGSGIPGSPVTFGQNGTIYHYCTINSEGAVNPAAPTYATGSTLIYNSGNTAAAPYSRSIEWGQASAGAPGYPWHVVVQNGTNLNLGSSAPPLLECGGNLTIGIPGNGDGTVNMNSLSQPLIVKGHLTIGDTLTGSPVGTLNLSATNGGDLYLYGNFTRGKNSSYNDNSRAIYFKGTADATINTPVITITPGIPSQYFSYARIDKTNGTEQISLNCPVGITQQISFTKGIVNSNTTNLLSVTATAATAVTGGNTLSYVNGHLKRYTSTGTPGDYLFPLGDYASGRYKPLTLTTINNLATGSPFTGKYFYTAPPTAGLDVFLTYLYGIENNEYWQLDRNSGSTSGKVTLPYVYPGANNWRDAAASLVTPCAGCNVAVVKRSTSTGAGNWDFTPSPQPVNFASTSTPPEARYYTDNGDIISSEVTTFSPFTFGFGDNFVLPVRLLYFTGTIAGKDALLNWQVAGTKDLEGFELQHSPDGRNFTKLAYIGAGVSGSYQYPDQDAGGGDNFYRLLVYEKSGGSFYSNIVLITLGSGKTRIIRLLDNPVETYITPIISSASVQPVEAVISDAVGRQLLVENSKLAAGENRWKIPAGALPHGVFFINIRTGDGARATFRFIR